jgi:hypothetical protein
MSGKSLEGICREIVPRCQPESLTSYADLTHRIWDVDSQRAGPAFSGASLSEYSQPGDP